jgi:hypothetical protein
LRGSEGRLDAVQPQQDALPIRYGCQTRSGKQTAGAGRAGGRVARTGAIEPQVDHRRCEQGHDLRQQQTADNDDAQRLAEMGARATPKAKGKAPAMRAISELFPSITLVLAASTISRLFWPRYGGAGSK